MDITQFDKKISDAVVHFWQTRTKQSNDQKDRDTVEGGSRGAVLAGKQLDGFASLLKQIALLKGVPESCIHTSSNHLPGYFRSSKNWDFLVTTPGKKLVCAIELKSHVGSFGNNFNNRIEESLGSSYDLSTALAEGTFAFALMPWVGYFILVENAVGSTRAIRIQHKLYESRSEFNGTSYLDRYDLYCKKLMTKKLYNHASLLWTKPDHSYGSWSEETSIQTFLRSYISNLEFRIGEFR